MTLTPASLLARLERAEGVAAMSIYGTPARPGDPDLGVRTAHIGGTWAFALTAIDAAFFNRVLGIGSQGSAPAADVVAASAFFRELGLGQSLLQVPAEVTTPQLAGSLEAAGYRQGRNWVKLWHPLEQIADAPTDLEVRSIGPDLGDAFAAIVVDAMGFPAQVAPIAAAIVGSEGWHAYLGFDGETPVAAGAMHIEGETAWLGFGATLEAARGRGGQSAVFARRLRDARELGCTLAVTETGEETEENPVNPSYRNMIRAGFTLAYARPNWVRIEATPPPPR